MTDDTEVVEEAEHVQDQNVEQPQEQQVLEAPKRNADRNWDEAREVLRLQKQRIEDLESRLASQAPAKVEEEVDEFEKLDPEDYLTVGKAKELARKMASKEAANTAKQVIQEYVQQQQIQQDESRMRAKHEDFDYVIENFAISMIKNDPALAYKIQNSKNPAETAYKLAKLSDEYEDAIMKKDVSPRAEKILKNSSRPVSANAVNSSLKSQADNFSNLSQSQVWEMSQKFARGA